VTKEVAEEGGGRVAGADQGEGGGTRNAEREAGSKRKCLDMSKVVLAPQKKKEKGGKQP